MSLLSSQFSKFSLDEPPGTAPSKQFQMLILSTVSQRPESPVTTSRIAKLTFVSHTGAPTSLLFLNLAAFSAKALKKLSRDHERSRSEMNEAERTGASQAADRFFLQKRACGKGYRWFSLNV
jgi:hypothetical protein